MSVALAQVALERGELEVALEHALEAWKTSPGPALARVISRISARLGPGQLVPSLRGRSGQQAWLALAERPVAAAIPALLDTLFDARWTDAIVRAQRMSSWPADPRVDEWCVHALERLPYRELAAQRYWLLHFDRLERVADPALLPRIEGLPRRWTLLLGCGQMLRWLLRQLGLRLPALRQRLQKVEEDPLVLALDARLAPMERAPSVLDELLAAIHRDPDDDSARLVYADALMERGDPRGEFIALQLQPQPDTATRRRIRALLSEHGTRWLGELAPIVKADYRFERGFLARCALHKHRIELVHELADHPDFVTVRSLAGSALVGLRKDLLALRELEISMPYAVGQENLVRPWVSLFSEHERPIERLAYLPWSEPEPEEIEGMRRCEALPRLRTFELLWDNSGLLARLVGAPVLDRLELLRVHLPADPALDPLPGFASALEAAQVPRLEIVLTYDDHQTELAFTRGAQGYETLEATVGPREMALDTAVFARHFLRLLPSLRGLQTVKIRLQRQVDPRAASEIRRYLATAPLAHVEVTQSRPRSPHRPCEARRRAPRPARSPPTPR